MDDMGINEKRAGLYDDPKFMDDVNHACDKLVSCSSYHRPDVAEKIKPDTAETRRSEKLFYPSDMVKKLFGTSVAGYVGFKYRTVQPYMSATENTTIQLVLHTRQEDGGEWRHDGEWRELTTELPDPDSPGFKLTKLTAAALKGLQENPPKTPNLNLNS